MLHAVNSPATSMDMQVECLISVKPTDQDECGDQ